jgi:hypothetical protein
MDVKPILSALARHRIAALLISLEIALACAVLCNAFFLVSSRLGMMRIDSGIDEASLATVSLSGCDGCSEADVNGRVLGALRAIPGVRAAGVANAVPFGRRAGDAGVTLDAEGRRFGGVPHFYASGRMRSRRSGCTRRTAVRSLPAISSTRTTSCRRIRRSGSRSRWPITCGRARTRSDGNSG